MHLDGKWHWRSYSISSSPADGSPRRRGGQLTITVKAMPEGFLSEHLVRGLEPGTIVRLALPQGEFVLPDPPPAKILFWTGGSGITPVMSMLRTLDRRDTMPDVVHIHSAPTMDAAIFREERLALAARHARAPADRELRRPARHPRRGPSRRSLPRLEDPRSLGLRSRSDAGRRGDANGSSAKLTRRLHLERFSAVLTTSAEGGRVTFAASGKAAEVDGATTLLEAGEAAGIQMPFGCRMGICHTCIVPLKKGMVKDLRNGAEYHENAGVQTCITAAAGDCVLEI